jgi:hypothetical protein
MQGIEDSRDCIVMVVPGRKHVSCSKSLTEIACSIMRMPGRSSGQFVQHFHINLWPKYVKRVFTSRHVGRLDVTCSVTKRDLKFCRAKHEVEFGTKFCVEDLNGFSCFRAYLFLCVYFRGTCCFHLEELLFILDAGSVDIDHSSTKAQV